MSTTVGIGNFLPNLKSLRPFRPNSRKGHQAGGGRRAGEQGPSLTPVAAPWAPRTRKQLRQRVLTTRLDVELGMLRYAGAAMIGLGFLLPHLPGRPGLPCPLRTATGVPCPFCGLTTSVEATLHGDSRGAWAANPFGLVVVAFAVLLLLRPRWRRLSLPAVLAVAAVGISWLFELHRYHFV